MRFGSAKECLDHLVVTKPIKHFKDGAKKIGKGLLSLGAGYFIISTFVKVMNETPEEPKRLVESMYDMAGLIPFVALGAYFVYKSPKWVIEGAKSLLAPFSPRSKDSSYISRMEGYTNKPTMLDVYFGETVVPVESAADIDYDKDDLYVVNGMKLFHIERNEEEYREWNLSGFYPVPVFKRASKTKVTDAYIGYYDGEFFGVTKSYTYSTDSTDLKETRKRIDNITEAITLDRQVSLLVLEPDGNLLKIRDHDEAHIHVNLEQLEHEVRDLSDEERTTYLSQLEEQFQVPA